MDVMPTDVHEFLPMFILKTKCFYSNIEKAFDLLKEVAFESKLDNKKRLKEIIGQIYTNLKITLTETGHKSVANVQCLISQSMQHTVKQFRDHDV